MYCNVVFEQKVYNGETFEIMYLDFGDNIKVAVKDYNAVEKVRLIKTLKEVK